MKRVLIALALLLGLWFGGRAIWRASVSDETRIRWVVDEMVEGFNETIMNPILAGLAKDYRDETYNTSRDDLRAAAASVFFTAKDPETRAFPYRITWQAERIDVVAAAGDQPARANATLELTFHLKERGVESVVWRVRAPAVFEEREGEWVIVRTTAETIDGRRIR